MNEIAKNFTIQTTVVHRTNNHLHLHHNRKISFPWKILTFILLACCIILLISILFFTRELLSRERVCLTTACVKTSASLIGAMDLEADPCENFFQFACGNWNREHVIPEDRASISTFEVLSEHIQIILKSLLEEPIRNSDSATTRKAKDFYSSCINITGIRSVGDIPLRNLLKDLGGWPVTQGPSWSANHSIEVLLGRVRSQLHMGIILELWIGPDDKNSSNNIIQVDQMTLGLPSREYFLNNSKELRAYEKYILDLAILLGASPSFASIDLQHVLKLETILANASLLERQETSAIYKKHTLTSLRDEIPNFDWKTYLETLLNKKLESDEPIVTYALPYLKAMANVLKDTPKRTVQNYVIWRVLMEITSHLVDQFQEKKMEFRRILMGVTIERSRWNQCVDLTNKKLGMALGAMFIKNNFDNIAKVTAEEMIHGIREAFVEILEENHWMDEHTKSIAKEKANKMRERIGYPDYLTVTSELDKEHRNLTIDRGKFLENILHLLEWKATQNLGKLRKPVDKEKWNAEPAVVNAFYDPNKNDIVFPAGILQPLFYSKDFPKSLNYGGIGVVIGHEITHGFDDKGRQFDSEGNLHEWWNNETIAAFRFHAQCIIEQYSAYDVSGLRLNGHMTQGENIADNGGLKQAFRAFKKWESEHGTEPLLPGLEYLSHDQLFFLNYAQIWCGSMRPEDVLNKIRSAVHSPGPIRVLGPLSNSKDFSEAFKCPVNSRMNPAKKCVVW